MNINVPKRILPALTAFTVVFASMASYQSVYADNNEILVTADSGDFAETSENDKNSADNDNRGESADEIFTDVRETKDENEPVKFSLTVTNVSEDGAADGSIKVVIENGSDDDVFLCSFNGGKSYRKMKGRTAALKDLKEGCYSVCVLKNKNEKTLSETKTVYISSDDSLLPVEISAISASESIYKDGYIKIHIENPDREKSYEASVDGGNTWKDIKGNSVRFSGLGSGLYTVTAREKDNGSNDSAALDVILNKISYSDKSKIKEEVPMIKQNPELPTGCEITSLTMLLRFLGFDADKLVLADDYLPKGEYRNSDFHKVFVGNPRNYSAYGCFAPAIVKAAKDYIKDMGENDRYSVVDITGCGTDSLYSAVDKGNPVLVWATMDMKAVGKGARWTVKETGENLVWTANEHCLVLTGYDDKNVYVNDPLKGAVSYERKLFEKRFGEMYNQAVIILRK